ncbi:MAG: hypothetical protein WAZ14_00280 [Patescibacteria group bacterium]
MAGVIQNYVRAVDDDADFSPEFWGEMCLWIKERFLPFCSGPIMDLPEVIAYRAERLIRLLEPEKLHAWQQEHLARPEYEVSYRLARGDFRDKFEKRAMHSTYQLGVMVEFFNLIWTAYIAAQEYVRLELEQRPKFKRSLSASGKRIEYFPDSCLGKLEEDDDIPERNIPPLPVTQPRQPGVLRLVKND